MVTKAIIRSINRAGNRCAVQIPLFETAADFNPVKAEALVSIPPGMFNNLYINDVVFVAFEENALEKPIIIGKLYKGNAHESETPGGSGIFETLKVRSQATIPATTLYEFPKDLESEYKDLKTPKKVADYIKWLESLSKKLTNQIYIHFNCFKNWVQWKFQPENISIDDGNIDTGYRVTAEKHEISDCKVCGADCTKNHRRLFPDIATDKEYPNT